MPHENTSPQEEGSRGLLDSSLSERDWEIWFLSCEGGLGVPL